MVASFVSTLRRGSHDCLAQPMTAKPTAAERAYVRDSGARSPASDGGTAGFRRSAGKPDFEGLYAAHARPLLAFLVYRTGEQMLAEDLMADTFERVLRTKRRFDPRRGSEKTWLYSIALNCLRDHARRASAEARAIERSRDDADGFEDPSHGDRLGDRELVHLGLAKLSDDERLVISLRYGADLTMPEIAKLIHQPLTTVEDRVYRALRKLRDEMAGRGSG
jgi:RNA polymerase sigma factor (sigma-70 family)